MKTIKIHHYKIVSPLIHPSHNFTRILHLTDLHVKKNINLSNTILPCIKKFNPDFLAITGDYVCYDGESLPEVTSLLRSIDTPKYATLGNHDHWYNSSEVIKALEDGGCNVLNNSCINKLVNGVELSIIGIDDKVTNNHMPEEACREATGKTRIVLSHVGDVVDNLQDNALILSGHTHGGGQILVPILTRILLKCYKLKYVAGFYKRRNQILYISSGLGQSISFRFRTRREICIFDLENGKIPSYTLIEEKTENNILNFSNDGVK